MHAAHRLLQNSLLVLLGLLALLSFPASADAQATVTTLHSFGALDPTTNLNADGFGYASEPLTRGADGGFYGVNGRGGGANGDGVIYRTTTDGVVTVLYNFDRNSAGFNGYGASSPLLADPAQPGTFYGATANGGANGLGTVFKMTSDGTPGGTTLSVLHDFTAADGTFPGNALVFGPDGALYGTTNGAAAPSSAGTTVFRVTTAGNFVTLHVFSSSEASRYVNLILGSDGSFYGMAQQGGANNLGSIFQVQTDGTAAGTHVTVLHSFSVSDGGQQPLTGLVQAPNGSFNFYGVARSLLFRITSAGVFTPIHTLTSAEGFEGTSLAAGADGNLYGTSDSTLFRVNTAGGTESLTTLYTFSFHGPVTGANADGNSPWALTLAPDGTFYGNTYIGGAGGQGTVFHLRPAPAHILTVTSTADDGGTGTLRSLIGSAAPGDRIIFDPALTGSQNIITLNPDRGELSIRQDLAIFFIPTQVGQNPSGSLTIDAGGSSRVLEVFAGDVLVSGMTLRFGAVTDPQGNARGGVVLVSGGALTLADDSLYDGHVGTPRSGTAGDGGVICVSAGNLTLWRCGVTDGANGQDSATNGGAVAIETGVMSYNGVVPGGAGIQASTLYNSSVTGSGGGLYVADSGPVGLFDDTVSGNFAGNNGGGIDVENGSVGLDETTLDNNQAFQGGGLFQNGGLVTLGDSTISNGAADGGAGLFLSDGIQNLTNVTLSGNSALAARSGGGGGLQNAGGTLTLNNCTVSGNQSPAGSGGGIKIEDGATTLSSSLVAGNNANLGTGADLLGDFASGGSNLIGIGDGGTGFTDGTAHDQVGTAQTPLAPGLDPNGLQDNGGPTKTIALGPGSAAIDMDYNNLYTSQILVFDQRIQNRPQGQRGDIGAFEVQDNIPPTTTATLAGSQGPDGAYVGPVQVTLTATSPYFTPDQLTTFYILDSNPQQTYSGPFIVVGDGPHVVKFYSRDRTSNVEIPKMTTFIIDTSFPTTTPSVVGPLGNNNYYRGSVSITLTATDPNDTLALNSDQSATFNTATIFYSVDGGMVQAYTVPLHGPNAVTFPVSGDGTHVITFHSVDRAGNAEQPKTLTVKIDATPPTLTFGSPSPALNASGFANAPVSIAFTTADNFSGVASAAPGSPLTFTGEGRNQTGTVTVTDNAGNTATFTSPPVSIDLTPPVTTSVVNGPQASFQAVRKPQIGVITYTGPVTITLSAADNLSGVAATTYTIDQGQTQTYTQPFTVSASGAHTVTFASTDKAGNAELGKTITFTISPPVTPPRVLHAFTTGLYLFSVPKDMTGIPLSQTFDQTGIKLAVWLPQLLQYVLSPTPPSDALRPGQGYWARFGQGTTNLFDLGTPTPTNGPFAIPIHVGWNMIGDPFPAPALPSSLRVQTSTGVFSLGDSVSKILLSPTFYSYDTPSGQYQAHALQSDALIPYVGYWLYSRCEGNLLVNAP